MKETLKSFAVALFILFLIGIVFIVTFLAIENSPYLPHKKQDNIIGRSK